MGWHGGHCGQCESCRRGDFICCEKLQIPGISYDGGYAEFVLVPVESLARIPSELTPEEAAPIMCAGVTTFNPLRQSGARPGDLVAVQGIGGLGHLGVQFASKFGASPEPFGVSSFQLIGARKSIMGWPSGTSKDSEDALKFAALSGVRPMIEVFPLAKAGDGYERMMSGKVRFRSVPKI